MAVGGGSSVAVGGGVGREPRGIGFDEMGKRWRVSHIRTCWSLPAVQIIYGINAV